MSFSRNVAIVFYCALLALTYYLFVPQLALDSVVMWVWVGVVSFVTAMLSAKAEKNSDTVVKRVGATLAISVVCAVCLVVTVALSTSGFTRTTRYHELLGKEESHDFMKSLPPLNLAEAPLVSHGMAQRAAEKKLSEVPALGSQAEVGSLEKQLVDGKLYWVGFLQHRGFWPWLQRGTTPGYVRVNATDPSDVKLVTELDGKPLSLRYLPSAWFNDMVLRYVSLHGYAREGLTDFSQEIDDAGRPSYVITTFERKVGFGGKDATGVLTLDVQTGEIKRYSVEDAPAWIDRIQPRYFVETQIEDRLGYVHGWWNPSHQDMLQVSGDLDLIYGADGRAHFFAGLGSTAREGGLVGFVMVDSRTKAVKRYNIAGVTESVATQAAEGVFPEKHYKATNPLPFLVEGIPSYVMALRDSTGIPRAYGIVDIVDYQKVAVAETLESAVRLFMTKVNQDRTHSNAPQRADEVRLEDTVQRISSEVRGGLSNYVLVLRSQPGHLFTADVTRAVDLSSTQPGDLVAVRTLASDERVQPILEFKNLTLDKPNESSTKH